MVASKVRAQIESALQDSVPAEVAAEKDQMIAGLRETNELNEIKVRQQAGLGILHSLHCGGTGSACNENEQRASQPFSLHCGASDTHRRWNATSVCVQWEQATCCQQRQLFMPLYYVPVFRIFHRAFVLSVD